MKSSRFTEEQIIGILKQGEGGMTVGEICREQGICDQTYYRWKAKYGGLEVSEAQRLRQLEDAKPVIESVVHVADHVEVRDRSAHSPAILQLKTGAAALVPPTGAAISLRLRSERHFNPTGGIRCE